jgi:sigma-B regulation protein RsbU (phosphoserine phosphatase)
MKLRLKIILISLITSLILGSIALGATYLVFNGANERQARIYTEQTVSGFVDSLVKDDKEKKSNNEKHLREFIEEYTDFVLGIYNKYNDENYFTEYSKEKEKDYLSEVENGLISEIDLRTYNTLYMMMYTLVESSSTQSLYLAYFDMDNGRVIYLLDVAKNNHNESGYVDSINKFGIQKGGKLPTGFQTVIENQLCWGGQAIYKNSDRSHRCCYILADVPMQAFNQLEKQFVQYEVLAVILVSLGMTLFMYILSDRFIAKNIMKVDESTKKFANNLFNNIDLEAIDPNVKTNDEIGRLSKNTYQVQQKFIEYINELKSKTLSEQRILADLELAKKIQEEALPKNYFESVEFRIDALMVPAKEVGGDFYDYFRLDDDRICIVIADVSGKGVPAALFMMHAKELISGLLKSGKDLKEVFKLANNQLLDRNLEGLFLTSFVGVLNLKNGNLNYINAGHEKPIIIHKKDIYELDVKPNFVLAGLEDYDYEEGNIKLEFGDSIFLYTDGINEAINSKHEEFGVKRIIDSFKENLSIESIRNNLEKFTENEDRFDDQTYLLLT